MKYLVLLLALSACGQQTPSGQTVVNHKILQNVWTLAPMTTAQDRASAPFYTIILASDAFNVSAGAQVISTQGANGCNSGVILHGSDNSGSTTVSTSDPTPGCSGYNGQTVTFQRIDDLTMRFCIGSSCASYQ